SDLWSNENVNYNLMTLEPALNNKLGESIPLSPSIKTIFNKGINWKRRKNYHVHNLGNTYLDIKGRKGILNPSDKDKRFSELLNLPAYIISVDGENRYNK